ncbi:hypothetical protein [Alteromonas stellipolaris]|uniref:Uncharacterized protein n=1 Tax=Alteromonas stellipolaris TaxID=233316 RepID=A0AAW7Z5U0_9ALTE|nr:hypothetical protein [Alteromonas stellipolaris]MDO6578823.1 hypothetical protein [Alteromonas stellipolaris]MDP2536453.1 hypothetical protein [Alteromonas stellipolaris]
MIKIALIGNSHAAMLKLAWDQLSQTQADVSIDFFIWRSTGENSLIITGLNGEIKIDEIKLLPGLARTVSLETYDAALICGLDFELKQFLDVYKTHRLTSQSQSKFLISDSCFMATVEELTKNTTAFKVNQALVQAGFKKVFLMPTPRSTEYLLNGDYPNDAHQMCIDNEEQSFVSDTFVNASQYFCELGTEILHQPNETIVKELCTEKSFSNAYGTPDSERYFELKGRRDLIHMNEKYGAIVIHLLLEKVLNS